MHNARSVNTIDPSSMYLPQSEISKRTTLKNVLQQTPNNFKSKIDV